MTKSYILDAVALANEVNRESESGNLTNELLANGHVLYGINPEFPSFLEQVDPDGLISLGQFKQGLFQPQFCLLYSGA